jgi:hypothetical protein
VGCEKEVFFSLLEMSINMQSRCLLFIFLMLSVDYFVSTFAHPTKQQAYRGVYLTRRAAATNTTRVTPSTFPEKEDEVAAAFDSSPPPGALK